MRSAMVARVAVDRTAYHFDKPYDYLLPFDMADAAKPGCRVMVPFGKGNRKRQGIILTVCETSEIDKLKPIVSVLDKQPVLSAEMLELAAWIREHTFCTWYEAVHLMLPAGINMRIVESYSVTKGVSADTIPDNLGETEKQMVTYLCNSKAVVEKDRLLKVMGLSADSDIPDKLVKSGLLIRTDDAVRCVGDATIRMIRLKDDFDRSVKLTEKQKAVVSLLNDVGAASIKEVCYFTGVTQAVINGLLAKDYITQFENVVYRTNYESATVDKSPVKLSEEQQNAYDKLVGMLRSGNGGASLLYGVTGSGKTQVFLKLVDAACELGKGVIVMVPEISLTPQTISLFHSRYGGNVAVFHSAMSLGQRLDEWKRVKNGDATVAIGTRSAVFAPLDNLGLIIIDEEQEHTYKSEQTPRFHARDVARFRCGYSKALLVLASATPSIESYSAAQSGRYVMCKLSQRYGNAHLPNVETVDMRKEMSDGNLSPISRPLQMKLTETIENNHQAILLLNRRGHNTIVTCTGCGHVITCPNCSISLTYHSANHRMMCHYCGYSEPFTEKCPECGNDRIRYSGVGTQRVEEELNELLPDAKVLRMDADSTMTRNSYEEKLTAFANKEYDIMLGTQMVAKGLNFPDVTLVGVLNADSTLFSEDFRSYERTFSLLTQVVGRSGRGDESGTAIVQTVSPDNEIISLAAEQNYDKFFEQEIEVRKALIYPPYCSICLVGFVGEDSNSVKEGAKSFLEMLRRANQDQPDVKMIVLGPSPAAIPKVSRKYRYRLIIKTKNNHAFRMMMSHLLKAFMKNPNNKDVTVFADINSESTF